MSFAPSIFVGAGGVGKNILLRIRRMMVENYGSLKSMPSIGFLHVDTHQSRNPDGSSIIPTRVLGENIEFTSTERVDLDKNISNEIKANAEGVRSQTAMWLEGNKWITNQFSNGAGAIRPNGKLAFQYSVDIFRKNFICIMNSVLSLPNKTQTANTLAAGGIADTFNVYIVCSLLGGTGSGSFLDICYNVREIITNNLPHITYNITGIFVIGGAGIEEINQANCYSALQELEYFTTAAQNEEKEKYWWARYPNSAGLFIPETPPVDECYLVSHLAGGEILDRNELEETIAFNLFLEFASAIAGDKRGVRSNSLGLPAYRTVDSNNRTQMFLTFGLSTLEFPAPRVKDWLTYYLAASVTSNWLEGGLLDNENVLNTFIKDQINVERTLGDLLDGVNSKIKIGVEEHEILIKKKIKSISKSDDLVLVFEQNIQSYLKNIKDYFEGSNVDMDEFYLFQKKMITQKERWSKKFKTSLIMKIDELLNNQNCSLSFLEGLLKYLTAQIASLSTQLEYAKLVSSNLEETLDKETKVFRYNTSLKEAMKKSNQWFHEALFNYIAALSKKESYQITITFLDELLNITRTFIEKVKLYKVNLLGLNEDFKNHNAEIEKSLSSLNYGIISLDADYLRNNIGNINIPHQNIMIDLKNQLNNTILEIISGDSNTVKNFLIAKSKRLSNQAINVQSITQMLNTFTPHQIDQQIKYTYSRSKVLLTTGGIPIGGGNIKKWLATTNPTNDLTLSNFLQDYINPIHIYGNNHFNNLTENYRIIFAEEMGIFPLRCITHLKGYENEFKRLKPPSTFKNIDFPLLFPQKGNDFEDEVTLNFRKYIEQHFQKEFATEAHFIGYATNILNLNRGKAEQVLDDESAKQRVGHDSVNTNIAEKTYQDLFSLIAIKGCISKGERMFLKNKQLDLKLSDEQIKTIEANFNFTEEE